MQQIAIHDSCLRKNDLLPLSWERTRVSSRLRDAKRRIDRKLHALALRYQEQRIVINHLPRRFAFGELGKPYIALKSVDPERTLPGELIDQCQYPNGTTILIAAIP